MNESVTGIPATDGFLQHGSKSQITDVNLCNFREKD